MRRAVQVFAGPLFAAFLMSSCLSKPEEPKVYTVEIKDMKFIPEEITLQKGDTVIWVNKDLVAHDVTEETAKSWSSGIMLPGSSWKMAVQQQADYYCSIHLVMKGKLKL